jgi:hypothetical protein
VFYLPNGTIAKSHPPEGDFFIQEDLDTDLLQSKYFYPYDQMIYDLDARCVDLYDLFQNKIFLPPDDYYQYIDMVPTGLFAAGLDSNFDLPKTAFEEYFSKNIYADLLNKAGNAKRSIFLEIDRLKYHYAYVADCGGLIGSLQELILATNDSFIGFYKLLCSVPHDEYAGNDYCAMCSEGRLAFNMLYSLIIQIYSILDVTTKIAYELEHLRACNDTYVRLASKNILYGDKNRLNIKTAGTIFERCRTLSIFENLRNEIVHNAVWELRPKVFFKIENSVVLERAIYMPDFTEDGTLVTYKNRKRFFADGKKINEELPALYHDFLLRLSITLNRLS